MLKRSENTFTWASLPVEVRLMVLEEILLQRHHGWASCAAVCKEWQATIEARNFRQLTLQVSCLGEFESIISQRLQAVVQSICLSIELLRYTCRSCQKNESMTFISRHNSMVGDAILRLFSILKTWQPSGRLKLELHAYSPSDSEHWFKNYHFGLEHENIEDSIQQDWHDPIHGWVDGQQVNTPRAPAILRLFSPLCLSLPENIPEVYAVTGFVIRRQLRHQISPAVLRLLWEKLPRLESIVYEPWRMWQRSWKFACEDDLASIFRDALPNQVKTVSIFEHWNDQLISALSNDTPYSNVIDTSPSPSLPLAQALALKSSSLECLTISYMIDAQQFFNSCQLSHAWPYLRSLALTSSILTKTAPQKEISALLQNASLAALNMPQLESMVLWNSRQGDTCAIKYRKNRASGQVVLVWRGTWDLSYDVLESWREATSNSYPLRIEHERFEDTGIKSHGDAIYYLRLSDGVIDSTSLRQMRQEGA